MHDGERLGSEATGSGRSVRTDPQRTPDGISEPARSIRGSAPQTLILINVSCARQGLLAKGGMERPMPLARYFSFVGGVLLALFFVLDACFPKLPIAAEPKVYLPVIRISSDRKWPERIVYDTIPPTLDPTPVAI